MIALENGAHRANHWDFEELNVSTERFPSGEGAAVFSSMNNKDTGWLFVVLSSSDCWFDEGEWCFGLYMSFRDDGWVYNCSSWTDAPIDDEKAALRVEEEMTEAFNSLVREIKAGRDPKGVAERYGFDQVDIY